MTRLPDPLHDISAEIDRAHERRREPPREHLGCSIAGHPCDRWLWLSFRWAVIEKFPGRVLRVFRRGRNEEATVLDDLRAAGMVIVDTQRRVFGEHFGGSLDGVIVSGVPEAPVKHHVLEIKTHSSKSFSDLQKKQVEKAKPMHWAQMQLYMLGTGIDRALYFAVCKDDDSIYTERVKFDKAAAHKLRDRAWSIIHSPRLPPPISADPTWYQCRFCPAQKFCHDTGKDSARLRGMTLEVNCRTCTHSTPLPDGTWRCERHASDGIPADFQRHGCDDHVLHPDLVPWKLDQDASTEETAVYIIEGEKVANGNPATGASSSKELVRLVCNEIDIEIPY